MYSENPAVFPPSRLDLRNFPVFSRLTGKSTLRDGFAADCQHSHLVAGFLARGLLFAKTPGSDSYSAGNIMSGVICLDAGVVLNALIVLNQLRRDAIRKVRGQVIEHTRF